jgi:HSP20 family protein
MLLSNWDPLRELDALRREVDRAFEGFGGPYRHEGPGALASTTRTGYPMLNVSADDNHITVTALAPGLDTESLELSVENGVLRIAGQKAPLAGDIRPERFHRNERGAGRFIRTLTLPATVDADQVTAAYRNGLLTVTLPKAEAAKPRRIAVSVN